jgi:hypothetical protein
MRVDPRDLRFQKNIVEDRDQIICSGSFIFALLGKEFETGGDDLKTVFDTISFSCRCKGLLYLSKLTYGYVPDREVNVL